MSGNPQISSALVQPVVSYLESLVGPEDDFLRELGIEREVLSDANTRVASEVLTKLLETGAERSCDPAFAVHAGLSVRPGQYGLLELLIRTSRSGNEVQPRIERSFDLIGEVSAPRFEVRDGRALVIHEASGHAPPDCVVDYVLASWLAFAQFIGGPDTRAEEVLLARSAPAHADVLREGFGCPVCFDSTENALVFLEDSFDREFAPTDPVIANAVERRAEEVVRGIQLSGVMVRSVEAAVLKRLATDGATLESISTELRISKRTLRRRLEEEGTSFKRVRDDVREREARRRLANVEIPIAEIAYDLGFSDPATFHRAFKRWTGSTPSEMRKQVLETR